jgi:predicted tellurium resistance membrane protein TerC
MKDAAQRSILRWIHLVFSIPIIGYIYSLFEALPSYATVVRYVALPIILLSGLRMWKSRLTRQLTTKELV